jgi:hypothetical protein
MGGRLLILEEPPVAEALEVIRRGIAQRRMLLIVGSCTVDYVGRASSKLSLGERVLLIKPDGSTLIHRPRDYAPVNWQPPGALFRTRLTNGKLHLRVYRRKEGEVLEITFERILLVAVLHLVDSGEFHLYASEEDMKRALLLEPSLLEEGFKPIEAEKPVEPGFVDILGIDRKGTLTVVEIKRRAADRGAVLQLKSYVDAMKAETGREVRGILVAPSLAKGTQSLIAALGLEFKLLSPKRCAELLRERAGRKLTEFLNYS